MNALAFLLLCFHTAAASSVDSTEIVLTAAPGDVAILPCYTVENETPSVTSWIKNGESIIIGGPSVAVNASGGPSSISSDSRLTVLHDGSLNIRTVEPGDEGTYLCASTLPGNYTYHGRVLLRVAKASDRHPECMWTQDSTFVVFQCSWLGAYPTPTLIWTDGPTGHILASNVTDTLALRINSSMLSEGQTLQCKAQHPALHKEDDRSCTFTLKSPYPVTEPLAAALYGTSVTLKCSEATSTPPAITTWRRGLKQELILNGSKYILTEDGPLVKLTIVNITTDDEGVYFCCSENPLGAKVLEVYLTVKTSSAYTGAVIGLFIAVLIVGSAIIIAKTIYSSRHKICLGGFGRMEEDGGDVLSLVESDEEQIFQNTAPRLPPVSNGCQTTLVEIHRIPSTDHEDTETGGANPQQQDKTDKTEEPEDLVTF